MVSRSKLTTISQGWSLQASANCMQVNIVGCTSSAAQREQGISYKVSCQTLSIRLSLPPTSNSLQNWGTPFLAASQLVAGLQQVIQVSI